MKKVTFGTYFREDSNQAEIKKVTSVLEDNMELHDMTDVHQYYLYADFDVQKLNGISIQGQYLGVREKEIFHPDHKLLKTCNNFLLKNFEILFWEMKTSSYKRFREWSEIPKTQKTLGLMNIFYNNDSAQAICDNHWYITFSIILQSSSFKSISNKLFNKPKNVEYDFFFDVKNFVPDPTHKSESFNNPILDFKLVKRPPLY